MFRTHSLKLFFHLSLAALFIISDPVQSRQLQKYVRNGNTVICGNVRFEFLTPSMGRMEYSPTARFVDAPTTVVLNRNFPTCNVEASQSGEWLTLRTEKVILKYRLDSGKFTSENTQISWRDPTGEYSWKPGDVDSANLGGVVYSLDGARSTRPPVFSPGILSTNGYFVLDDSKSPTWDASGDWIQPRTDPGNQDLYWIVYGKDYARALREYSELAGKIPMIPRYVFGSWITDLNYEYLKGSNLVEQYKYDDKDVRSLVERFRAEGIPLDVLVLDFAWHKFGWKGGYDWSPIFPDPRGFLQWAHNQGIKVSVNDHPGYAREGVLSSEDSRAARIVSELGITEPPKPTYNIDLSKAWKFKADSQDVGLKEGWYSTKYVDSSWNTINGGVIWEDQGFAGYDGKGWYRKTVKYPDVKDGTPVLLLFGGVDDEYDLFINGSKVAHYGTPGSSIWSSLTSTDVTKLLHRGDDNLIALRVNDWGGGGGISKSPVGFTDRLPFEGIRLNLADKRQATAYMDILHHPIVDDGIDFWWIDGGKGACEMDGLDGQMWTNRIFFDFTQKHTNKRAFIFSRYGGWGNHRYPSIFTGDTYSEWAVLNYEVRYSAESGNVLMPYVTHDIGGFLGKKIPFDLYVRWIQFGVFNPLLRLHSAFENPRDGNVRMPWMYGTEGIDIVRKYFELRYQLLPYIYTYARSAHDSAMPLNRPLYLEYPRLAEAYNHPDEYFFGREFLCAPIVDSSGERDVYVPPGTWFDYFTDKPLDGGRIVHARHPLATFPVYVRDGSIIPTRPNLQYSDQRPLDSLVLNVYGRAPGLFKLYDDDGVSLDYLSGSGSWTAFSSRASKDGGHEIAIAPTVGSFKGQGKFRTYTIILHGYERPKNVKVNGKTAPEGSKGRPSWEWSAEKSLATIHLASENIRKGTTVSVW